MKVVVKFDHNGQKFEKEITQGHIITIGRTDSTDWKIPDPLISTYHCSLELKENGLYIIDTKSKNGTFLNGIKIKQGSIYLGDELKIGDHKITIVPEKSDSSAIKKLNATTTDRKLSNLLDVEEINRTADDSSNPIKKITQARYKKLSKSDIIESNRFLYIKSIIFNFALFIFVAACPFLTLHFVEIKKPFPFLVISEAILLSTFYHFNFKKMEFNIGEKLAGIQKVYKDQDL